MRAWRGTSRFRCSLSSPTFGGNVPRQKRRCTAASVLTNGGRPFSLHVARAEHTPENMSRPFDILKKPTCSRAFIHLVHLELETTVVNTYHLALVHR